MMIHAGVISSFFRISRLDEFVRENHTASVSSSDSARRVFDWKKWNLYITHYTDTPAKTPERMHQSIRQLYDTSIFSFEAARHDVKKWLAHMVDFPHDIPALLQRHPPGPAHDSLFAASEMLRRALAGQLLLTMIQDSTGIFTGDIDWNKMSEALTKMLREHMEKASGDTSIPHGMEAALAAVFREEQLQKLLEQAFLFSMRDVAWKRLKEALQQAIEECLAQESGAAAGKGWDSQGRYAFPSRGKGGSFLGFDRESAQKFESRLLSLLIQKSAGSGLGNLASLFPQAEMRQQLSDFAKEVTVRARGGGVDAKKWAQTIAFARIIEKAFRVNPGPRKGALQQAEELLNTIDKILGRIMASQFSLWPSAQELKQNPWYFNELADSYWNLVYQMSLYPNLITPNLNAYSKAALEMRNRMLPQSTKLLVGSAPSRNLQELFHFTPRNVFIGSAPLIHDTVRPTLLVKPEFATHAWGAAIRSTRAIILDGILDEWGDCSAYALWGRAQGPAEMPPLLRGGNFLMTQWDNRGFYCAYRINDAHDDQAAVRTFWEGDALELFFDPHNAKDSIRIEGRNCQFWIWPRLAGSGGCTGQSIFTTPYSFDPRPLKDGIIRFASRRSGGAYSVEAFIPSSLVPAWHPLPGKIIGFNYSINNGEFTYIRWVTNKGLLESVHPNLWGDLLLMGSDALVTVSPDEFIVPGQNITVTVLDADMNLDAAGPDVVWVVVSAELSGDSFPLSLAETGTDSGIFSALLGTVFGVKAKVQDRLSVRPGEIISLDYVDQHASGGRKNVQIHKTIEVGRGVFSFVN